MDEGCDLNFVIADLKEDAAEAAAAVDYCFVAVAVAAVDEPFLTRDAQKVLETNS